MIRVWSYYRLDTGEFTGRQYGASTDHELEARTPSGCGSKEGRFDPESQRVDLETGDVVRHVATARIAARERREAIEVAKAERAQLEYEQIRSISALITDPTDAAARENFDRRKTRIEELRDVISAETETTEPSGSRNSSRDRNP